MMASALLTSGSMVTDSRLGIVLIEKNMSLFCFDDHINRPAPDRDVAAR